MIGKYNYRLETGDVSTNDDNIASMFYNINLMEKYSQWTTSDIEDLKKKLGEYFANITTVKVHLNRIIKEYADKLCPDTIEKISTTCDKCMTINNRVTRTALSDPNQDITPLWADFHSVYKKMLELVPYIEIIDAQNYAPESCA
jgi:hypothetical protein